MSYWKSISKDLRTLDNFGILTNDSPAKSPTEFYELELGVVLDVILDENHPIFTKKDSLYCKIDINKWPADLTGSPALPTDIDYSWIGRVLVRPIYSEPSTNKNQLIWAIPLESNLSEYPLINEVVIITKQLDKLYYTRKLNCHNWPNNNLDFGINNLVSGTKNTELFTDDVYKGKKESIINAAGTENYKGYAGKYFSANNNVRSVRRFEGDLVVESRHGQSIRFSSYDKNRNNDLGSSKYKDYVNGGNPMILIRNRQRPLLKTGQSLTLTNSPNPATVIGSSVEKNTGGYLEENINHDGSSIHITSGQTISGWVTTCYKKMFGNKTEEVSAFSPAGSTSFKFPVLDGDQIVITSDRLILSSRYGETFHYSKKRYGIVTDSEYTVDAHDQIVMTTHVKTVINSPAIYLGEYDQTGEPALLGQTTINWLIALCNWLLAHTHWYHHSHVNAGKESPEQTQLTAQKEQLIQLRDSLQTLASRRVFLTGGGFAPGQDGKAI